MCGSPGAGVWVGRVGPAASRQPPPFSPPPGAPLPQVGGWLVALGARGLLCERRNRSDGHLETPKFKTPCAIDAIHRAVYLHLSAWTKTPVCAVILQEYTYKVKAIRMADSRRLGPLVIAGDPTHPCSAPLPYPLPALNPPHIPHAPGTPPPQTPLAAVPTPPSPLAPLLWWKRRRWPPTSL